jgi:hypothetical protein
MGARFAGDNEIATLLSSLPHEMKNRATPPDSDPHYRPSDFAAWRAAASTGEWLNPVRFERLIDIMEKNPTFWVYVSY